MPRDASIELAEGTRTLLVAPAGYGKTHTIALAAKLAHLTQGRQLILTHTHAGVQSIKTKLRNEKVPQEAFRVETIAGWTLKYASAFKSISGLEDERPRGAQHDSVYTAFMNCLVSPAVRKVITSTYGGFFVDEYQDCMQLQHDVVLGLAELLPCRVVGDPLQGIFDFAGPIVDFDRDLDSFDRLEDLDTPHRWLLHGKEEMAKWVVSMRKELIDLGQVTLDKPAFHINQQVGALEFYAEKAAKEGIVCVIHQRPDEAHEFAKGTKGQFKSMEEMECKRLLSFSEFLDKASASIRVIGTLNFAQDCAFDLRTEFNLLKDKLRRADPIDPSDFGSASDVAAIAARYIEEPAPLILVELLKCATERANVIVYRKELLYEGIRAIRAHFAGDYTTFADAAYDSRDKTRQRGRPDERLSSSRVLLVKGLEYDYALVANADQLKAKELYVALTRGCKGILVQSSGHVIRPSPT